MSDHCGAFVLDEPKLFIGMLSRTAGEDEVRHMCRPYGSIESVTVLRDGQGKSKGDLRSLSVGDNLLLLLLLLLYAM